jgi:hypothetical protein
MKNKQILIISPEPWQWQYVNKHHYAITLSKLGYKVCFFNPPKQNLKAIKILKTDYKDIYKKIILGDL